MTELRAGDFAGLTGLRELNVGSNRLTSLPAGIFAGLTELRNLRLSEMRSQSQPAQHPGLTALAADVFSGLTRLQVLRLDGNGLTALPADLFAGLTALHRLELSRNPLRSLPAGIFSGLRSLTSVRVSGDGRTLPVAVALVAGDREGQFKARIATGAPFRIALPVSVDSGTIDGRPQADVIINTGWIESDVVTVERDPGSVAAVTVDIGALPNSPTAGYALHKSAGLPLQVLEPAGGRGVCARTPQVRDELVKAANRVAAEQAELDAVSSCAQVSAGHLAMTRSLDLRSRGITELAAGDFAGLTQLTVLVLGRNELTSLPAGIFSGMTRLTWVDLSGNRLTSLPPGLLPPTTETPRPDGYRDGVRYLDLRGNRLTSLPAGMFAGLTELGKTIRPGGTAGGLYLSGNQVDPLPLYVSLAAAGGAGQVTARVHTGAPGDLELPVIARNGRIDGNAAATVRIAQGAVESEPFTVVRAPGAAGAVSVRLGQPLPTPEDLPHFHYTFYGFAFRLSSGRSLELLPALPAVAIAGGSAAEGAGTIRFRVSLSRADEQPVSVDWRTAEGTALEHTQQRVERGVAYDYHRAQGSLIFRPGETERTITVKLRDDLLEESEERFTVVLSNVVNASIAVAAAAGTIEDDDGPLRLRIADGRAGEADGALGFAVRLDRAGEQPVTLSWATADGTALAGVDYAAAEGTLTFAPGDTERTLTVMLTDDALDEPEESFTAALSEVAGATLADGSARGTIADDDAPPALTIAGASAAEADAAVAFSVRLAPASAREVRVGWATQRAGTALAGVDYAAAAGTLTFAPGETERTVAVTVLDDTLDEAAEEFTVALAEAEHATLPETVAAAGTIIDDDPAPALRIGDASALEAAGAVPFVVTLGAVSGREVRVGWATRSAGTALAGADYDAATGTLTFAPGQTERTVAVTVLDDALDEAAEEFTVALVEAEHATLPEMVAAAGTIIDDDPAPALRIGDASVLEDAGPLAFPVSLSAASGRRVTVDYATAGGTARQGRDFQAAAGALTFASGDTQRTITVVVTDETLEESDEQFTVGLTGARHAALPAAAATGTIIDNDRGAPELSIADAHALESDRAVTFTVRLSRASTQPVTVAYATADDTATAGADYTAVSAGLLTFAPGARQRTLTVALLDDALEESEERFTVTLRDARHATLAVAGATGTIGDDDAPALAIADAGAVEDDGALRFTATLSRPSDREVTVAYATADGTATAGADYRRTSGTLVFAPGSTRRTITVTLFIDDLVEGVEEFTVTLSAARYATLADAAATGTIADLNRPSDTCDRTAQVRAASVAVAGVGSCGQVSQRHLTAITELDLSAQGIGALRSGDFAGMVGLRRLDLSANDLTSLPAGVFGGLRALTHLDLGDNRLQSLRGDLFAGLVELAHLRVTGNQLSSLPDGIFAGLTALGTGRIGEIDLSGNRVDPLPVEVSVAAAGNEGQIRVRVHTGAPFQMTAAPIKLRVVNGTIDGAAAAAADVGLGALASRVLTVARTPGTLGAVTVAVAELPPVPRTFTYYGFALTSSGPPLAVLPELPEVFIDPAAASEGRLGIEFRVWLSRAGARPVTLDWATADGTALAGVDYDAVTDGTLIFQPGQTEQTITVTVPDDDRVELEKSFTVVLSNIVHAAGPGGAATVSAAGSIEDDEGPPHLRVDDGRGGEDDGAVRFAVRLSRASEQPITVRWATADGTALAGADYDAARGTLTFLPGEPALRTLTVRVRDDTLDEPEERFTVLLHDAQHATLADGGATGTIADDDAPPALSIRAPAAATAEAAGAAQFSVRLDRASGRQVQVDWATADGTALAGADYDAGAGTLAFAPGVMERTLAVTVRDDALDEPEERFTVLLQDARQATLPAADRRGAEGRIGDDDDPPALAIGDDTAAESRRLAFPVTLSAASGRQVTVAYATADGTAVAGRDYTAAAAGAVLTFTPGETTRTISVAVRDDALDEYDEMFAVELRAARHATLAAAGATGTIRDDDPTPELAIAGVSAAEAAGRIEFPVTLSAASSRVVTVDYATAGGTALAGRDYREAQGTLSFAPAATRRTITVWVIGDALDEGEETFTVTLRNAAHAVWKRASGTGFAEVTATGTITDGDGLPHLSLLPAEGIEGAGAVVFPVRLSAASAQPVTVAYATADGSAAAGADYTAAAADARLTILRGARSARLTVAVADDTLHEGAETFTVTLSDPAGATVTDAAATATGTIFDDDGTLPLLTVSSDSVSEERNVVFPVRLSAASAQPVTAAYATVDGSATAGEDYTAPAADARLTIAAGATSELLTVAVTNDAVHEGLEGFAVILSDAVGATVADRGASATILDNDAAPVVSIADRSAAEATGEIEFTVTLAGATRVPAVVEWSTADGTAQAGRDYVAARGRLVFAAGETTATIRVWVLDEALGEADERFTVSLSDPQHATLAPAATQATGTIRDDDRPALAIDGARISERAAAGGSGALEFRVTLRAQRERVTVDYATADGAAAAPAATAATAGQDYTAVSGTLTFTADAREQLVRVPVLHDTLDEADETLTVRLSNPSDATLALQPAQATGTIHDDDAIPTLAIRGDEVWAEDDGLLLLTATLDGASGRAVTVDWATTDGTAVAGADYTAAADTLTIAAGQRSATILVELLDDALDEADETFAVTLSNPAHALLAGGSATATITDDDDPPALSLAAAEAAESSGAMPFTVTLSAPSGRTVAVDWATVDHDEDTATAGEDYAARAEGTLAIAAGQRSATFSVALLDDALDEADETFTVMLRDPPAHAILAQDARQAVGTILDDDAPPALELADRSVPESAGEIEFTVWLSAPSGRFLQRVPWAAGSHAGDTATAGEDYTAASGTLTILAGARFVSFAVPVADDRRDEADETFTVTLGDPLDAPLARATVTIEDDDTAGMTVSSSALRITEGGTAEYQVLLHTRPAADVTVAVTVELPPAATGAPASVVTLDRQLLEFAATNWSTAQTVTVTAVDNAALGDAAATLRHAVSGAADYAAVTAAVALTIVDDDIARLTLDDATGKEQDESITFTVRSTPVSDQPVTVAYATAAREHDTAAAGADYTAVSGATLSIAARQPSATFTVAVTDDELDEHAETFSVTLSNPSGNALVAGAGATGTIADDDDPPALSLADASAPEGGGGIVVHGGAERAERPRRGGGLGDRTAGGRHRHARPGLRGGDRHAEHRGG